MPAVSKKLKSQAGVAMVIALVFLLLCIMVGMVILTASTVSAGSVALERQTWRETEALTSAAQLLADDVKDMTFTGGYTRTETVTTIVTRTGTDTDGNAVYKTNVTEEAPTYAAGSTIASLTGSELLDGHLNGFSSLYYSNHGVSGYTASDITLTLAFAADTGGSGDTSADAAESTVPDVTGTLTVGTNYTITAVLKCEDSALTMVFEPQVSDLTGTAAQRTTTDSTGSTKTTTIPYTTTIKWGDPEITKGVTTS